MGELVPEAYQEKTKAAVRAYWSTLSRQGTGSKGDQGRRSNVTGGKQMDGFCELVRWLLHHNGVPDSSIYWRNKLELPGFYRATKRWDLLVVHRSALLAAIEFKSQASSFGNNVNNRIEEAIGTSTDVWVAFREGAFGKKAPAPWLGWVMLLEDGEGATSPVQNKEPHYRVFPEFEGASYAQRYELLFRRLVAERQLNGAALLMSSDKREGVYREPARDLSMKRFLASLGGHVQAYLASV